VRQQSGREALFVEVDDGFGSQVRNVEGTAKDGRVRVCKDILGFAPGEQTLNAMNTSPVMGCGVWISLVLHLIFGLVVFGLCRWYARVYKPFFQTASVVVMTDQRLIMHTVEATDGNAPLKGQRYVSHIIRCCFDIVPEATILQYEATAGGCCSGGGTGDGSIVCVVKGGTLTISSHLCTQPVDQILEPWFALSGGGDDGGASKSAAQADPVDADVVDEFSSVLGLNETLEAAVVASEVLRTDPTDELSCRALRKCRCTKRKNLTVTRAYAVSAHKLFLSSTWTASNSKSSFTSKVVYNLPVRSQSLGAVETVAARPSSMLDVVYPVPHLWCCGMTPPGCCSGGPVRTDLGLPGLKLEWHGGGEANSHKIDMELLNPRADDVKRFVSALMRNAGQSVV
jgi:hypothetical protein